MSKFPARASVTRAFAGPGGPNDAAGPPGSGGPGPGDEAQLSLCTLEEIIATLRGTDGLSHYFVILFSRTFTST